MKELISEELYLTDGRHKRLMTQTGIAYKLMEVFKFHVGSENAVSRVDLFYKVFNKAYNDDHLADYVRWDFVKKAMHLLRVKSNCFIGSEPRFGSWYYFVIKTEDDADKYVNLLNKNIKRMKLMQKKAKKSVKEQWFRKEWSLSYHPVKVLK